MLYNYYSEKLLGIQDVNIKKVEEKGKHTVIIAQIYRLRKMRRQFP